MWPLWIVVLLAIGAVIIVVENLTIIILVLWNKSLRSYTNGFIVSLAFSDVLVGGVFIPAYLASPGLGANGYMVAILLYSNVSNICALTAERYFAISRPLQYHTIMSKYFVHIIIASWVIPISISLLPLAWSEDSTALIHKIYVGFLITVCTMIPCIYVICVYCLVYREVKRQLKWIGQASNNSNYNSGRKRINKEAKIAVMFAFIAGVFVASWAPSIYMTCVHTLAGRSELIPDSLTKISVFLIELGAATNAVLYSFYKNDFRWAVKRAFGQGAANFQDSIPDEVEQTNVMSAEV